MFAIPSYKAIGQIVGNILAFQPYSNLLARASIILARPVCRSTGLLAYQVHWPANKLVKTNTLVVFLVKCFNGIKNRTILT